MFGRQEHIVVFNSKMSALLRHPQERWLLIPIAFHIVCAAVLAPVTSHPYDFAVLTSNAQAWLTWGFSPFYHWKFGLDFAAIALLAQALRTFLTWLHVPGIVALHIAWKLPLIASDVLTAGAIYKLGQRLAPDRAAWLAALWLVNPVVLWVSAGHGQVESIAILSIFAALLMILDGRLLLAGVITGLGAGVGYYPIAVVGVVLVWWRGGQLRGHRPLVAFGVGLAGSLALCFLPLIVDPIGRSALFGGLASSGGLTSGSVNSLLAGWAWLGYGWAAIWPALFVFAGVACLAIAWLFARRGTWVGIVFLSAVLVSALLLDVNTLPQFAAIAAAALWLLALTTPVEPLLLIAVPMFGLATYFVFLDSGASTANAFFFDDWFSTGPGLLSIPTSPRAAAVLGHLFSLGLLTTILLAAAKLSRLSKIQWHAGAILGSGLCILAVGWASQPVLWAAALSGSPSDNVPDFQYVAGARDGSVREAGQAVFLASYPGELITAADEATVKPTSGFRAYVGSLYSREEVGKALPAGNWPDRVVTIPDWSRFRTTSQSIWVQLLLGSTDLTESTPPKAADFSLYASGTRLPAITAVLVLSKTGSVGWALVTFHVPSILIDPNGRVDLLPFPTSLAWNGSDQGPWVRIRPASGEVHATINQLPLSCNYEFDSDGRGYIAGFPLVKSYVANLDGIELPSFLQIDGAVLRWPTSPEPWKHDPWWQSLGAIYGLLMVVGTGWALRRCLRSRTYP